MTKNVSLLVIFGAIIVALVAGYIWLLENIEDPEADMRPLAIVADADAALFEKIGLAFPATDGVKITLNPAQIRILVSHLARQTQSPKLTNRFCNPYIFSVMRDKDKLAPHGFVYTWVIKDVGRDNTLGTADDHSQVWAGRP